ncbi:hypothetical protein IQ03_01217 [Gemmobacter caeni]|uniref:DotM C-terminal cytoplasmic domain-containing protein n=1 Tax=Gemmobacter caeni TaxID=589035 RepID=A0A2T6B8X4_9RHOB|nr:hypothetical protein [Gemmobacter caeni]PTX52530.1 hypothetical protein C8N34_102310 [Gemmobacter caeni]TWJ02799.1 hypothetical protein IQ03_01217 [Gemmobacter caeni]
MSQNPNAGQGPNADQESMRWLFISIALLLITLFAWTYLQPEINVISGVISWAHILPYAMAYRALPVLGAIPLIGPSVFEEAHHALRFLEQGNYVAMTPEQRMMLLTIAGRCAIPLYVPLLLIAGTLGRSFRPDVVYRVGYTLETMIRAQSEHWLTSRMSRHVNPLRVPEVSATSLAKGVLAQRRKTKTVPEVGALISLDQPAQRQGAWQRALRPEEWLLGAGMCFSPEHAAAAEKKDWEYPSRLLEARDRWPETDIESLCELLAAQLRTPWTGFKDLRPGHQAICAVMASFYSFDITGGNALLNDLGGVYDAIGAKPGGMDKAILAEEGLMPRIRKILDGKPGRALAEVAARHAWVETAFPAMLQVARKDRGVLPAAAFLWLKGEDRLLWYILDNVGSDAVMIESAGAMSHFKAEVQIGLPIRRPAVFQAARALREDYLDVTEARLQMRAIKRDLAMTPEERIRRALEARGKPPAPDLRKGPAT